MFADPSVGTVTKPILSGAVSDTSPSHGHDYILVVHQEIKYQNIILKVDMSIPNRGTKFPLSGH